MEFSSSLAGISDWNNSDFNWVFFDLLIGQTETALRNSHCQIKQIKWKFKNVQGFLMSAKCLSTSIDRVNPYKKTFMVWFARISTVYFRWFNDFDVRMALTKLHHRINSQNESVGARLLLNHLCESQFILEMLVDFADNFRLNSKIK